MEHWKLSLSQILLFSFFPLYALFLALMRKIKISDLKLRPAFYASSPPTIKYSEKHISEKTPYQELSITAISEICGLEKWTDSLLISKSYQNKQANALKFTQSMLKHLKHRLQNPLTSLVVCEIDTQVGKGLFLDVNEKMLPKDTLLGIYAGKLQQGKKPAQASYLMSLWGVDGFKDIQTSSFIDAREYGNFFRFMQDLPSEEELQATTVSLEMKNQVATENITTLGGLYRGYPVMCFMALRDIHPGEQLGYSYRGNYWEHTIEQRRVFNKWGRVIGQFTSEHDLIFDQN